jgi:HD-GYP domain-containing protein (c-di-GMP phosphodiesterase class II)
MFIEIRAIPRLDSRHRLIGLIHVVRDISERKKSEERIQRQIQRLSSLRSIDLAITSSLDLAVTLNLFIDHAVTRLGVDAANVLLLNPHGNILEYAAGRGFRTDALKHIRLRLGEGYAGVAALENRIVSVPDFKQEVGGFTRSNLLDGEDFATYYGVHLVAKGQVKGVLEIFHRGPLNPDEEWFEFLEALALQAAIAIDNSSLFSALERSNKELSLAYDSTIEGWSRALDYRDKETEGHARRVTELTVRIALEMGMNEDELVHVRRGALLHDIGKMGIPDSVLLKPGALTDEEWKIMRLHPVCSYELLYPITYLRPALDIPYYHHEKWDGSGYPKGLAGEQIPLSARIFAVVDVWDALSSDRPYRPAWSEERAKEYIISVSGIQFDPKVVELFVRAVSERKKERKGKER